MMTFPAPATDDAPAVPLHDDDSRLAESQTELEAEEDPRLVSDHDLPPVAEIPPPA